MRKRKTIEVELLKHTVNRMIAAPGSTHDGRVALGVFLSSLLLETGNYHGFNYLEWVKEGGAEKYRYLCEETGQVLDVIPFLGDQSRVEYY